MVVYQPGLVRWEAAQRPARVILERRILEGRLEHLLARVTDWWPYGRGINPGLSDAEFDEIWNHHDPGFEPSYELRAWYACFNGINSPRWPWASHDLDRALGYRAFGIDMTHRAIDDERQLIADLEAGGPTPDQQWTIAKSREEIETLSQLFDEVATSLPLEGIEGPDWVLADSAAGPDSSVLMRRYIEEPVPGYTCSSLLMVVEAMHYCLDHDYWPIPDEPGFIYGNRHLLPPELQHLQIPWVAIG